MAELNQQQVIDYIKGITVLELSQLVKALEEELGVSAAAAMPMAVVGGAPGGGAAAEAEEQTEFTATLTEIGAKKINVIKVVREVTSLGLQGGKGPRGERPAGDQGGGAEGRGRSHPEEVRGSRGEGRDQVARVRAAATAARRCARCPHRRSRVDASGPGKNS